MDKMKSKLNRIEGQIKGIQKMYDEGRDCLDIVQQVIAARQALGRIGKDLLTNEAVACSREPKKQEDFDKVLKSLFDVI
ncbi:metal-sensitive transcriptional regulator [Patescibacteria group bacterium]